MIHIVESLPLTKFADDSLQLQSADDNAVTELKHVPIKEFAK